jgi:23S rRNA-/tRNA-specific pseudouridylate synthase
MRVTTYYFFTRQVFPFKLVNAKHESKLSLGFKLLFCDTFWLGQNICSPCNSRSIDHSRRLSVLSGASQSSQIFLNLKRRTTGGRRGLSFDEASRVVEMESKDPKKDESTQKNECSGQEWIELSASPLNEKGSSGGNNPEYVDVGKNGRHTHASKKTKRKKKRGYAKTPLDWSNIDQSEAQRHVGYVDFSDWLVDHQKIESVPCEASSDKTPENAPQKVEQFIPGVQAHKNHLPETPAIDATNVPESVRQYERQLKKQRAAARVARPITMEALRIVYIDKDIVVANKSSGTLTVPGVRGNPSLAQIVYDAFGCESGRVAKTIVHRLDMDTSGLVVFAKTNAALSELHRSFRDFEVRC